MRFMMFQESCMSQVFDFTNVLARAIPTHVIVGYVDSTVVQGTKKLNPFNFANYMYH